MEAVAAFCVINTDISVDLIPKSTRNKLNRKIPYAKQRDHYPAVLIGQIAVFDAFLEYHLVPAISEGYVCLLYPDKPRHPRQKYLLTLKGQILFQELTKQ